MKAFYTEDFSLAANGQSTDLVLPKGVTYGDLKGFHMGLTSSFGRFSLFLYMGSDGKLYTLNTANVGIKTEWNVGQTASSTRIYVDNDAVEGCKLIDAFCVAE